MVVAARGKRKPRARVCRGLSLQRSADASCEVQRAVILSGRSARYGLMPTADIPRFTRIDIGFFGLPSNPEDPYYPHKFGVHLGNPG